MSGRYHDRVRDLLVDAEAAVSRRDWDAVRDLAGAALALAPGDDEALRLLEAADAADPSSGERRQLTVMFCDVVGSTALSQQRDPELVREVLRSYQVTCDRVVRRYEGRIARYVGDGVLAYFGHPVAHEDDARRGVKAGLDLLEALRPVVEEVRDRHDIDLRIRVAVHTGVVVRADMGSAATPDRDAIVGETPNVAARLQDHAQPGSLIISHDTYELVRGYFLVAPLGPIDLRGIDGPVRAYHVVDETTEESRVHATADLSPFVGRAAELALLTDAWTDVLAGASHVLAISGQPGVGKSRLADVLRRRTEADEGTVLMAGCSSYHGATALYPVRRLIERVAGIDAHQDPVLAVPRLWTSMEVLGQADAMPLVADLLDLPPTSWCPAPELEGAKLREQLLSTLLGWVRAAAARGPTLLIVDDLQWADPTTMELLGSVVRARLPGLLLLATVRDDAKVPWSAATVLPLDRLSGDELGDLARRLPEGRALDAEHLERVIERSDGIPLFLEELLRSSAIAQRGDVAGSAIPAGLRDLLLARFAAPGVDLRLAQTLATIGTEAPFPLIAAVSDLPDEVLEHQLGALVDAGILTIVPGDPMQYQFRHHLLADLAYDTQLQGPRRHAHNRIADALVAGHGQGASAGPVVRGYHLERAGRPAEAVLALAEAAEAAHAIGANLEVAELLERAFTVLEGVEPGQQANELEFELRLVRGISASSIMGYAAPQAVEDFEACLGLLGHVEVDGYLDEEGTDLRQGTELVWSVSGLWATFMLQGKLDEAHALNQSVAERLRPDGPLAAYFDSIGAFTEMFRGDYLGAIPRLAQNVEDVHSLDLTVRRTVPGDPSATGLAHLAWALTAVARFDEARTASDQAIAVARSEEYPNGPFSLCYAASMRAGIEVAAGDIAAARRWTAEVVETSDRHGFTFWTMLGAYYLALVDLWDGVEGAVDRARGMVGLLRSLNVLVWLPSFLAGVSAALLKHGEAAVALPLLAEAAELAEETGARFYSAEIARQRGEALVALGEPGGVELMHGAVDLAAQQGATLFELWARTSLCRQTKDPAHLEGLAALLDALPPGASVIADDVAVARALLGNPA